MPRVMITTPTLANLDGPHLRLLQEAGFEVGFPTKLKQLIEEEMESELKGVVATIAGSEPYTSRVIEKLKGLRVIARSGVGFDAVDVKAATSAGIAVTITPGANHDAVAEHTFALLLALSKNVVKGHVQMARGAWKRDANQPLRGRVLGLIGLGRIGKAVAMRGLAFGMKVIAVEAYPDKPFVAQHGIELVDLDTLLAQADYVSLHAPLTPETQHLMNSKTLAKMKPTSFLVNTARGGLVNENDLLDALQARRLAGAGLDVFEQEPPGEKPLYKLDNVVCTPHLAGIDDQSRLDMAYLAAKSIVELSQGRWPAEQMVNPELKERFRWS